MDDFTLCDILIKRIEQQRGEVKKEFDEAVDEGFDFMVNEVKELCGVGPSSSSGPSSLSLVSGSNEARVAPSGDGSAIFPPGFSGSLVSGPTEAFSASSSTQNKIFDVITTSATTSSYSHHFTSATPKLMTFSADLSSSSSSSIFLNSSSSSCALSGSGNFWSAGSLSSSSIVSSSSVVHSSSYTTSSPMIIYGSSTASSSYGSNSADYGSSYDLYDSNASSYGSHGSSITFPPPSTYPSSSSTMIDHYSNHKSCTYYNLQQKAPLQFKMAVNESEFMVKQEELEEDDPERLQQQFKVEDIDAIFRSIDESSQFVMPRYTGQGRQGTQVFSGESSSFVQQTTQDFEATDQLQPISSDHELLINEMLEDLNEGEDYFFRNFQNESNEDESFQFKKRNRGSSQDDPNEEEEEEDEEGKAKGSKKFTILGYWCDQAECELNDKKLYVDKVTLNHHLKDSHGIEAHRCCIQGCGKSFINKYKLTKHVSVHGHLNPFTCGFCPSKHFKTYDSLSCHHLKFHERGLYVCAEDSCTFTSTYRQAMYYHWLSVHEARHVCAFCDRSFVRKSLFDSHMRIHAQVKPYKCIFPGCDTKAGAQYMSRDRSAIVRHIRVRHFGLPRYMKEQIQREIVDTRDPNQFISRDIN